jgi:hypothetical protein
MRLRDEECVNMVPSQDLSRRRLLGSLPALVAVAGCVDDEGGSPPENGDENAGGELDLQEANVVDVAFEEQDETYTFDVTLHHDDDGEEGYANWWQIEDLDGTRLGRRDLSHAHSQQPFTRPETVEIPSAVTCVVVRGHDQMHGYGGRAMLVNLDSGDSRAVEPGSQSRSFDTDECP